VNPFSAQLLNLFSGVTLEAAVLGLAWKRKIASRLPFFAGYLLLLAVGDIILFGIYQESGFYSKMYFYAYWVMQASCISLRAVVVYEICENILSPFTGIWRLVSPLLLAIAGFLIVGGAISARGHPYFITTAILTGQRGLELVVIGLLVTGLAFCRYYGVQVQRHLVWIAFGLGFYSIAQAADNTFLQHSPHHWLNHFAIWEELRLRSFNIAVILWGIALWKPLPAAQPAPVLLGRDDYERLSPIVTMRLRELNTRLLEMWK
jgi:hypothetical protein